MRGRAASRRRGLGCAAAALLALGACAPTTSDVPGLMAEARRAEVAGHHTDALRSLRRAEALAPEDPDVALLLGVVALRAERPREADAALARAVQLAPHDPRPLAARGLALRALHRYDEAESALLRSLMLRPADPATLAALGETYRLWGKPEKCATRYEQYLWQMEHEPAEPRDAGRERALADARRQLEACEADAARLRAP